MCQTNLGWYSQSSSFLYTQLKAKKTYPWKSLSRIFDQLCIFTARVFSTSSEQLTGVKCLNCHTIIFCMIQTQFLCPLSSINTSLNWVICTEICTEICTFLCPPMLVKILRYKIINTYSECISVTTKINSSVIQKL